MVHDEHANDQARGAQNVALDPLRSTKITGRLGFLEILFKRSSSFCSRSRLQEAVIGSTAFVVPKLTIVENRRRAFPAQVESQQ